MWPAEVSIIDVIAERDDLRAKLAAIANEEHAALLEGTCDAMEGRIRAAGPLEPSYERAIRPTIVRIRALIASMREAIPK